MQPDPWSAIGVGSIGLTARRVDPDHPANFFWAKDNASRCALVLRLTAGVKADEPRPKLNGIEIIETQEQDGATSLVLVLRREEDRELFQRLCEDIIESCRHLDTDPAFLSASLRRAWKWHSLLRGAGVNRLTHEEQQGLIGELLMVETLSDRLSPGAVLAAWRGPLDEPKDFVLGHLAIEVKARHASKDAVKISSEHQLQLQAAQALWLAVVALSPAAPSSSNAVTLDGMVERVRAKLTATEPSAEAVFESLMVSAGYSAEHDYATDAWTFIAAQVYHIDDSFPRIQADSLPAGVSNVAYWLSLNDCAHYARPLSDMMESLRG